MRGRADTYGWDTVFAVPTSVVNDSIKAAGASPTSFRALGKDSLKPSATFEISGTFDSWSVAQGGSGNLLRLATPVPKMLVHGTGSVKKDWEFHNGSFEIQVVLAFIPDDHASPISSGGRAHKLVVDMTTVTSLISSEFPQDGYQELQNDVESAVSTWFAANIVEFTYVFATIELSRDSGANRPAWLLPTYAHWAYTDSGADGILGILCMTESRSPEGLTPEVSPNAIPGGSQAGFLLAHDLFVDGFAATAVMSTTWPHAQYAVEYATHADGFQMGLQSSTD